jgi:hypothetical protein
MAALVVTAAACSGDDGGATAGHHHGDDHGMAEFGYDVSAAVAKMGHPDRPVAGPQGRVPQFVVECPFSHALPDDPIVYPGQAGASHLHVFFGNETADAASTLASLEVGTTTCEQQLDRASYWAPALLAPDGRMVTPEKSTAYYRAGEGIDPTTVQPYPPGLMMIAGDMTATEAQPQSVTAWTCGASAERFSTIPTCPEGRGVRMVVTFPDCWDGSNLDSHDHRSHVAYSTGGACASAFPVSVPQLTFTVAYDVTGDPTSYELASGGVLSGHADFVNAWDETKLATEVTSCLHRGVICGVTSGRV